MSTDLHSDRHLIRIGDLARRAGKSVRAIHLYEEVGLLHPVTRSSGGFRLYAPTALERVRWIELLHGLGFSLHEMRKILRSWWGEDLGPVAMSELRELFHRKLEETRGAVARGQALERELVQTLHYLEACKACDPPRSTRECTQCPQDHHMEGQPPLVSGLYSTSNHAPRRAQAKPGFIRAEDIGHA
jgi:DNA-binding transcriptional MerR regulator